MDNHIVTERCKLMRSIAKRALKGNWIKVVLGFLIYSLFANFIPNLLTELTGIEQVISYYGYDLSVKISTFASIYKLLLLGVFTYGSANFFVSYLRCRDVEYTRLFDGFNHFGKILGLYLLIALKVFLWALLFVIPGIIAAFRYSQSFYILYDHPEYTVTECINESKRLMSGNKGKYFLFLLSYIGWMLLAGIPNGIFEMLIRDGYINSPQGAFLTIISFVLLIPELFVETYIETGSAVFYDLLTEKLVPATNEEN